tara:strand:+ start:305 stop:553 length:249 start_codon:yes stop_codon:yes gene_type:complete
MTIAYYRGKRIKAEPKSKPKKQTKPISDDVINQDEVEYNKLQNKIMDDKINNAYFSTVEKLNKVAGLIVEGAMKKHKQEEDL